MATKTEQIKAEAARRTMIAMMDFDQLKAAAKSVGRDMRGYHRMMRTAPTDFSRNYHEKQLNNARARLRQLQAAYRRRLENMKARGL